MNSNPRVAVVGTAGHIDHGKTALVRRLTGVNTDRLPEEKKRGISIDLGFAPLVTPAGVRVGLVDVPGHERFVKNMLAGVGGVDAVLLVIAADEGVMPQTREHLAIVQLLQVKRGVIVLTKRDLVDADWAAMVSRDARELVRGTTLAEAPIVECSAVTGEGCDALLATLDAQLTALGERPASETARLPVDRVFTVEGFGTVVTGTLWRGRIVTGDTLVLQPGGHDVRVRRVQVHGATVDVALAGQRTALALHGVDKADVARGDWLVAAGSLAPSRVLEVRFELLADAAREFRSESRVRFHLGASELLGRLVLLEGRTLAPGASALAQLRLESAAVAARGDRFVIRSWSPSRTIGGGVVIEPAGQRRRRAAASLAQLALHESGSREARLLEKLAAAAKLQSTAQLASAVGESETAAAAALESLARAGELVAAAPGRWCALARWNESRERIARAVGEYSDGHPARFGVMKGELKSSLKAALDAALFDAAFASLVADATLEQQGERVRPAGRPWTPPAETLAQLEQLERQLEADGYLVPENDRWMATLGPAGPEVASLGHFLGRLVRVSTELTYTSGQITRLRESLREWFAAHRALTVADLRGFTGASRKFAVPLLEFADRTGWTVRDGDERKRGDLA